MSPILVVEITYDFGLRIETGTQRPTSRYLQNVQDAVIHLEVDEEQGKITQGSKRQAKWIWSPRAMSGLRLPDSPHPQQT